MTPKALIDVFGVFGAPWFLAGALAGGGAAGVLLLVARRRSTRRREGLVAPALAARAGLILPRFAAVPVLLVAIASLGVGAALARPHWGAEREEAHRQGTDVVLLLDTSASMRATDVTPSRFALARQAALSLLSRLPEDRIALVACEGDAQVLVPLTLDTAAAALFLEALEPGVGTLPGTSLAAGLTAAAEVFPAGPSAGRQCVVISDGEDLEGGLAEATKKAKREGIVVHTVLVGLPKGAPVPEVDVAGRTTGYKVDAQGSPVLSHAEGDTLKRLAADTSGSFSIVSPGRTDLDGTAREIDKAARRPLAEVVLTSRPERYQLPLAAGAAAVALLLLGRLPSFRSLSSRKVAAALLVAAIAVPPSGPVLAAEPPPAPAPAAEAAPSLWKRFLSSPPFTTARGEAKKGARALEEKKVDEALSHFSKQKELAPSAPTSDYNLGSALGRAGKAEEAVASLETARKATDRGVAGDAAYNEGKVLYAGGDYPGSARAFRQAVRLAPGDADASWNYELALRRAEEERKKQEQKQKDQQKKDQDKKNQDQKPDPKDKNQEQQKQEKEKAEKERGDREFKDKAKMSREKAEQLLAAIANADRDEQRKKLAEQRKQRRVARDW